MRKIQSNDGIASWKIISPTERMLSAWADRSSLGKALYVLFYQVFDREYYQKGLRFIDRNIAVFVGDVTPKQRKKLRIDMVYSLHRFGCAFDEYFLFDYPNLNVTGRNSFITDKIRWDYYARMNKEENKVLFNDKRKAYTLFEAFYKRELIEIRSNADAPAFYSFVKRNPQFIVKPIDGSGGRGIFAVSVADYPDEKAVFDMLREKGHVVVEQMIVQAEELAAFNPSSVNTLRVVTLKLKDRVVIFYPVLRTGVGSSIVDNASSGGIIAPVDAQTGIVTGCAKDEKGNCYIRHPNSKVVYPGFQVPRWQEAVSFVTELAYVVETNHYVGWDLALTQDGWVMVEGNPRGQWLFQYATAKGLKQELEDYIRQM